MASLKTSPRPQGRRFTAPIILLAVLDPAVVPARLCFAIKASAAANKFEEVLLATALLWLVVVGFCHKTTTTKIKKEKRENVE